jgi:hypothetical protein
MHRPNPRSGKASTSFCEQKEAKKLFIHGPRRGGATGTDRMKFFARFFSKERRFP